MGEPVKTARACDMPVSNTRGQTYHTNTGVGEANNARQGRTTQPCAPTCPRNTGIIHFLPYSKTLTLAVAFNVVFMRKEGHCPCFEKRKGASSSAGCCIEWTAIEQVQLADTIRALLTIDPWELFFGIIEPTYLELMMELCSTFHLQTAMMNYDDPGTVYCQIHHSHFCCWDALVPGEATYNPSRSKASALSPSLRYLHAILAHTITRGERELALSTLTIPTSYGACRTGTSSTSPISSPS
ncbi:hypothetical protein GOBAR_AA22618 [Gossypium barbadense]|uniref:Uncharacterized protein n=1 Tax=Gossypium barbadense TaxID=3634 RepID=A0A2P5X410_GOSBA|nr:hypothetical protein GOBAR_AA22618 [Gossypium barbadense]